MGKLDIKVGIICLGRHTFDVNAAKEIYLQAQKDMATIENVQWITIPEIVITQEEAKNAAEVLLAANVDALSIISGTFHLGHLPLIIDRIVKKPVLLWAFNELPYTGGKISLNSVCAVNLNASNLYKAGNDNYHCIVADVIDRTWIEAIRMRASLEKGHVGIAGFRADGFFNLAVDELRNYKECGVLLDHYELEDMFKREATLEEVAEQEIKTRELFDTVGVTDEQVHKVSKLCVMVEKFLDENKLDALAIRCWPEYAASYGISPCAMMSILQSMGRILSCEGDVEAAMTMLAMQAVGAETPFLADLSQVNFEEDFALMWHCGVAPANLWDKKSVRSLDTYFAGGKGVTAGFVLKSGPVNIFRIDSARGKTRVFIAKGKAVDMEKQLTGTYAKVIFDCSISKLLETVTSTGVAHHVVMVYGDYIRQVKLFAKIMNWEVIEA
jgi:L-fucose isomerase-like protein